MEKQRIYPIGEFVFEEIRNRGYVYVDKTAAIYQLVSTNKYYFLSRPRRFGKSLLISTLDAYFSGKKDLFRGLAIDKMEKDWVKYPILHLDLSSNRYSDVATLEKALDAKLERFEKKYELRNNHYTLSDRLVNIIHRAVEVEGQKVVILIDEYDAPLLDVMGNRAKLEGLRNTMRSFFSPLKTEESFLRFVLLTGITKFSQMSIFSELNHLDNISMSDRYSAICGITENELLTQFGTDIHELAQANAESDEEAFAHLKAYYDGYHFSANSEDIFNPFSLLNCFNTNTYDTFWFSTGTPHFLLDILQKTGTELPELSAIHARKSSFDRPTEDERDMTALLYQSGYLTIKEFNPIAQTYTLGFPNEEVRTGFADSLANYNTPSYLTEQDNMITIVRMALSKGNIDECIQALYTFFAGYPYDTNNNNEKHYQGILYTIFTLIGARPITEKVIANGRIDMVLELPEYVYIFELKVNHSAEIAIDQIKTKGYAEPYVLSDRVVHLVGVNFDSKTRNIDGWKSERM